MTDVQIRAKAFADGPTAMQDCIVEKDGSVLVYDSIAGYYTRCHSMSERDQERARRLARLATA